MTTSLARVNIAYFLLSSAVFVRFSAYKYVEDGGIMLELIFSRKKMLSFAIGSREDVADTTPFASFLVIRKDSYAAESLFEELRTKLVSALF